jgi:hypothetical protein
MGNPYVVMGPIYWLWVISGKIDAIKRYGFGSIWVWVHMGLGKERKSMFTYLKKFKALN